VFEKSGVAYSVARNFCSGVALILWCYWRLQLSSSDIVIITGHGVATAALP